MGIFGALGTALSGIQATRSQIDVVAVNISNAETPGYTRKSVSQTTILAGDQAIGVQTGELNRQLDTLLQRQIRSELSATGNVDIVASYNDRLNQLLGQPGSPSSFDSLVNTFGTSLSTLSDDPSSFTAQQAVLSDAQILAESLNSLSDDVQILRTEAEQGIAESVRSINNALDRIFDINNSIISVSARSEVPADLLDERDRNIDLLAQEIDIQVIENDSGTVSIFTTSGVSLFDGTPARLNFDQQAQLNATSLYSSDPAERTVGTVTIGSAGTGQIDLLAGNNIRSGRLAGYVEMRDSQLVEMQDRLDEFAHQLALSLSLADEASAVLSPPAADTSADLAGTGTFAPVDFTNGGANDGSISFDLTVDGATQTVDVTFAEVAALPAADPANVTQAELVSLINQEANTAFSTVGVTYAVSDGTAIDLRSQTTGPTSNVSVASYTETNLLGTTTLADGAAIGATGLDGLQIDLTGIQPGNTVSLTVTDASGPTTTNVSLIHVTDASVLPLPQDATADPNDLVIGVDLTDPAAVEAALAANGLGVSTAAGAGGAIQFIDDGAGGQLTIDAVSARLSVTTLNSGEPQLPLFNDGIENNGFYTGSYDGREQRTGFAARIQVNTDLIADPSSLSRLDANTASGDDTRPTFLFEQFTSTRVTVSSSTGIGTSGTPLEISIADFGREIVNKTAFDASTAQRAKDGQDIVTNGLLARQNEESGVNIDEEVARLTELQNVYAANAQVLSVAREMMDLLLSI